MLRDVRLTDKYEIEEGQILISGAQALVRLLATQQRRDAKAGLNTAGYVSGYRGSPLGGLDQELMRAHALLQTHRIRFQAGVNEDLAATAIWGTQQIGFFPGAAYEGVFSLWYGKGPGVDRSGDAFKHANRAGVARNGGVLVAFGDDHTAESSTLAHQSEMSLIAAMIPVLNPASVAELLEFGLYGWALSRYSGLWASLKCVSETVATTTTVDVHPDEPRIVLPNAPANAQDVYIRNAYEPVAAEQRMFTQRLPRALEFVRANRLNRTLFHGASRRLGLIGTGQAFSRLREALTSLGFDDTTAATAGVGLFKVGVSWPLEPHSLREFASGYEEILVVEDKLPLVEDQVARILYDATDGARPRLVGKRDETGAALLSSSGSLTRESVRLALLARFRRTGVSTPSADVGERRVALDSTRAAVERRPHFCSGCPHNRSTVVPSGSHALAGIGCSYMALWMDRETHPSVQMGGEGANWIGAAQFTQTPHVFQNIGDGTYFHSGLLAIRAAVASGVNITYRVLYNDAVAMTGGQAVDGELSVAQLVRQVLAEGVRRVAIVSEAHRRHARTFSSEARVSAQPRTKLDAVQERLREERGVTILIYEQMCAAEKRRRRKRGSLPDPPRRVFINPEVCEGCGDCSVQSNCVSLVPLATALGRKRRIDQSSCNKDYSCIEGFCPSFITVEGARLRRPVIGAHILKALETLPEPKHTSTGRLCNVLITGIGGSGVVTVGAILAMSAHLERRRASVSDMMGLAQKNGAVTSHVRIAESQALIVTARLEQGDADLIVGCDAVVTAAERCLQTVRPGRTRIVLNTNVVPTGEFQRQPDMELDAGALQFTIESAVGRESLFAFDAAALCMSVFADNRFENMLMLGYAYQSGVLPVSSAAIDRAIELNDIAVSDNKLAFAIGRLARHDFEPLTHLEGPWWSHGERELATAELIERNSITLESYQNRRYASRYLEFVQRVKEKEKALLADSDVLTRAVARSLFKLMAYKDEYEVARLHTDERLQERLRREFEDGFRLRFHLAPPLLSGHGLKPRKREFGQWILIVFSVLAALRGVRGTPLDIFGYTRERRMERRLIEHYRRMVMAVFEGLEVRRMDVAERLFRLPEQVRGFGHVKLASAERVREEEQRLLDALRNSPS